MQTCLEYKGAVRTFPSLSKSGVVTLASAFQAQIVGFGAGVGRVWSGSPYVGRRQIKKMKAGVAPPRQMDAVTRNIRGKSRVGRRADTWLQSQRHQEPGQEGRAFVCDRLQDRSKM